MGGKQWTGAGVRSGGPQRASARLIPTRAPLSGAAASSAMSRSGRARSSSGTSSSCFEMYERAQHASVTTLGSGRKSRPARWRTARVLSRVRGKQSEIAPRSRRDRDEIATRSHLPAAAREARARARLRSGKSWRAPTSTSGAAWWLDGADVAGRTVAAKAVCGGRGRGVRACEAGDMRACSAGSDKVERSSERSAVRPPCLAEMEADGRTRQGRPDASS